MPLCRGGLWEMMTIGTDTDYSLFRRDEDSLQAMTMVLEKKEIWNRHYLMAFDDLSWYRIKEEAGGRRVGWTMSCIHLLLLFVRVGSEYILFCYLLLSCWSRKPQRPTKQQEHAFWLTTRWYNPIRCCLFWLQNMETSSWNWTSSFGPVG